MQFINYIQTKLPFYVALSFTFVLASCGSYQYVGYDSDGIYGEREVVYEEASNIETETPASTAESNSYYKNYFNEKANQYNNIPNDERIIFTDIDSYEGDYSEENQEDDSQNGYAGWGQASNNVTINYIDYSWGNYSSLWNGGYGWGWNNWGWNSRWGWNAGFTPYGWGWNNWGWNAGWGWNYWGWNAGWGYNNFWCPPGFNGYYYNNRGLVYHSGRRGSNLAYGNRNSVIRRNSSATTRRNSTIRRNSSLTRTRGNNNSTIRRNTTRTRATNSRSNSNITRPRSSSTRSNTRVTTPIRSNSSRVRSSGSTSRSSGTSRSSSSRGSSSRRR